MMFINSRAKVEPIPSLENGMVDNASASNCFAAIHLTQYAVLILIIRSVTKFHDSKNGAGKDDL